MGKFQFFKKKKSPKRASEPKLEILDINALAIASEPQYFVIYKSHKKKTPPEFKSIGEYVYEIRWGLGELANPNVDPIGVFGYSGNRRYIWQNKFWAELDLFVFDDIGKVTPSWPLEQVMSLIYPLNEEFDIN
jgi:hypothetical protein